MIAMMTDFGYFTVGNVSADKLIDFYWKVIGRYDSYIGTTNAKAAFLIAWNTFAIGSIGLKWGELLSPFALHPKTQIWATICLILIVICGLAGLWKVFGVVTPFLGRPRKAEAHQSVIFFEEIARFETNAAYHAVATELDGEALAFDLASQAYALAKGLSGKFAALKVAIGIARFVQIPAAFLLVITYAIVAITARLGA
jgi:hypothetical protein